MTPRNLKKKLPKYLTKLYADDLPKGQVYDITLEIIEFITDSLLHLKDFRCEHLVHIYGLESDVLEGLPDDSRKILSYNFANNVVQQMFDAKRKQRESRDRRIQELLEENLAGQSNVEKIH